MYKKIINLKKNIDFKRNIDSSSIDFVHNDFEFNGDKMIRLNKINNT